MPLITCMCPFFVFLAISIRLLSPFSIWQKMIWTNQHDILLCREILVEEPYKFKHGSRERGQCWNRIANALSRIEKPSSRFVTSCAGLGDDALTALVSGPCAASSWAASWIVNSLMLAREDCKHSPRPIRSMVKRSAPKQDPCFMPQVTLLPFECTQFRGQNWVLF